jgi:uncharacterized protein YlzI (FlbEa/FlbD family)
MLHGPHFLYVTTVDREVIINPLHIVSIQRTNRDDTVITMSDGSDYYVQMSVRQIYERLEKIFGPIANL